MSSTQPSSLTPPFVLPFSGTSVSYFVAINPNIDTLKAVPLSDGSPDLLFAAFGQGSVVGLEDLLGRAHESFGISVADRHSSWTVLDGDGIV